MTFKNPTPAEKRGDRPRTIKDPVLFVVRTERTTRDALKGSKKEVRAALDRLAEAFRQ